MVHAAFSTGVEGPTKGWQARFVPLSDGAADAFVQLAGRKDYLSSDDYVFCNRMGRPLDGAVCVAVSSGPRLALACGFFASMR